MKCAFKFFLSGVWLAFSGPWVVHAQPAVPPAGVTQPPPSQTASSRVYRCGNAYTNDATEAHSRGCKPLEGAHVTVVQGTRVPAAVPRALAAAPPSTSPADAAPLAMRVDSSDQRARDADARVILEAELRKALALQSELQREYNNGEPEKLGPETRNYQKYLDRVAALKASIARNELDISGLRRELSRLTASK